MPNRTLVCMVAVCLGTGCGAPLRPAPAQPGAGCGTGVLEVEVGTGASTHEPLTDGDEVLLAPHPQGGFYLPVSVRTSHADRVVELHASITDPSTGTTLAESSERVQLVDRGGCVDEYWGLKSYLSASATTDIGARASEPGEGAELELGVWVENLDGSSETSSVLLTLRLADTGGSGDGPERAARPPAPMLLD